MNEPNDFKSILMRVISELEINTKDEMDSIAIGIITSYKETCDMRLRRQNILLYERYREFKGERGDDVNGR